MKMKKQRKMDGVLCRVCREGNWMAVCFSDLTSDERASILDSKDEVWVKSLCCVLADTLYKIGEHLE